MILKNTSIKLYRVILTILFTLVFNLSLFAETDLSSYSKLGSNKHRVPSQSNLDLNSPKGIYIPPGGEIKYLRTCGRSGTGGVQLKRHKKVKKHPMASKQLKLKPGSSYNISVWVKCNDVLFRDKPLPGNMKIGCLAVEYFSKKKYLGGSYFIADPDQKDWQRLSKRCDIPADTHNVLVRFYLHPRFEKGTIFYDDLEVSSVDSYVESYMLWPTMSTLKTSGGKVKFKLFSTSPDKLKIFMKSNIVVKLDLGGKRFEFPAKPGANGVITINTAGPLPAGAGVFRLYFTNTRAKKILDKHRIPVNVLESDIKPPPGSCTFDRYGRALVDGKLFMPIGIYQGHVWYWKEMNFKRQLDELAGSAFNCALNYFGTRFSMDPKPKFSTVKTIRETLDYHQKLGLKSIFYLKYNRLNNPLPKTPGHLDILENIKNHPALLAWYIVDEPKLNAIPKVKEWRETLNRIDPFHPTYIVHYKMIGRTAAAGDILGGDHYPVGESNHMLAILNQGKALRATGRPMWSVPQIFNWGVYRAKNAKEFKQYQEPGIAQMRGMFLQIANEGARGFIMYSHHDLYRKSYVRKSYQRRWKDVKEIAQMLKDNERFIMSRKGPQPVKGLKITAGIVSAKKYIADADGEVRVFVTGVTAKSNKAVIAVNAPKPLKSRYRLCKSLGNNKFEFVGKGICGDILE